MRAAAVLGALALLLSGAASAEACDTCGGKNKGANAPDAVASPEPPPPPAPSHSCTCCSCPGCAHGAAPAAPQSPAPEPPPAPAPSPIAAPHKDEGGICPIGQTIVLLRPGVDPDDAAAAFASRYQGVVCRVYRHSVRGVTLRCTGPAVVKALSEDPLVLSTEPDVVVKMLPVTTGEAVALAAQTIPTGLRRMGFAEAARGAAAKASLSKVGVAVIDTGIDAKHPDLTVVKSVSCIEGEESPHDGNGHGTHCAGTIAARDDADGVVGIAPGVRLYAVKVLDDEGSGALSDVIAGLEWVARHSDEIAVANLSLGVTGKSASLRAAIQACVAKGVIIVAAAGNDSADVFGEDGVEGTDDDRIPAAFPEVCAVSALADSDGMPGGHGEATRAGPDDSIATFSCHSGKAHARTLVRSGGGAIDVAAPGVEILSTWTGGGWRKASGTSMASPHVAGLLARMVAQGGRDWNHDGKIDAADVYAIRQALVDGTEGQSRWRRDGATVDTDTCREGLARIPGTGPIEQITAAPAPSRPAPATPPPSPAPAPSLARTPAPAPARSPAPSTASTAASTPARSSGRPSRPSNLPGVLIGDQVDAPPPPAALAVPGVEVVAIVPGSDQGERARGSVLVGLRNLSPRAAQRFDVILLDAVTGRGLGRYTITSLDANGHRTIVFPFEAGVLDGSMTLRAVVMRAR